MTSRRDCSRTGIQGFGIRDIGTLGLIVFIIFQLFGTTDSAPFERSNMRTIRLCSRRLSDALYLVCSDRGYNEPFSYSGEDDQRGPTGPGLVEECCYHSCSYGQLEQYCKQTSEKKRGGGSSSLDVIEESIRIVNLPSDDSYLEIYSLSKEEKENEDENDEVEEEKEKEEEIEEEEKSLSSDNHSKRIEKDCRSKTGRKQGRGDC